jgi:hypothetical protein
MDYSLLFLMIVFFFMLAAPLWIPLIDHWEKRSKKKQIKNITPEEYFSDCEGDVVKMADKFLKDTYARSFSELIYLQRELIKAQKDSLK